MKPSNVFAFLGGVAAGAIIALLTTPRTGQENRQLIIDKLKSGAELTKKELRDLTSWITDQVQEKEIVDEIEDLAEEMDASYNQPS